MSTDPRTELRALALWHTRRRIVDEMLAPLLEYGPVAVERVADRLAELQALVADEQGAFTSFVEVLAARQQVDAIVLDMFPRRTETPKHADT